MGESLPLTLVAYRVLAAAATPLAATLLRHRLKKGKEHPSRMNERRGDAKIARPPGPLIWLHGASVGELLAVVPLIERIRARGFKVLVTSGTVTSAKLAAQRLPPGAIHQFIPYDAPPFMARFLDHWRPDLGIFVESDLWPSLIVEGADRELPMILVNGRMSERSHGHWRRFPRTIAALLQRFDLCLAQSLDDAERLTELGAPRVQTTGNLKLDVPEPPAAPAALAALRTAIGGRIVIAATSTHQGEEYAMIEAHRRLRHSFPGLLTIIAPRHPERGRGIAEVSAGSELNTRLRSRGELPDPKTDIYVADTLGELGLIYRLAPIVFIGGSLIPHGGQNPIEAAKLGAAIVHGPHVRNFKDLYAMLDAAHGAVEVADAGKLAVRIGAWLKDGSARLAAATAARQTVDRLGGALDRTLTALEPYLMQLQLEQRSETDSELPPDDAIAPDQDAPGQLSPNHLEAELRRMQQQGPRHA
jgi:3-deoxy-D-manno-octulosonic-acid transferase